MQNIEFRQKIEYCFRMSYEIIKILIFLVLFLVFSMFCFIKTSNLNEANCDNVLVHYYIPYGLPIMIALIYLFFSEIIISLVRFVKYLFCNIEHLDYFDKALNAVSLLVYFYITWNINILSNEIFIGVDFSQACHIDGFENISDREKMFFAGILSCSLLTVERLKMFDFSFIFWILNKDDINLYSCLDNTLRKIFQD